MEDMEYIPYRMPTPPNLKITKEGGGGYEKIKFK